MQTVKISALAIGFALLTAACGDSMSSLNPTAPSALSPDSLNVEAETAAGAAGSMGAGPKPGTGNAGGNDGGSGNGNGNGNGNGTQPTAPTVPHGKSRVQLEGSIEAVGASSITVRGQVASVNADTVIRHGHRRLELSELKSGDRVHVSADRDDTSLEAVEILLQNPGSDAGETVISDPLQVVTVDAADAAAYETGPAGVDTGAFRLTRTGTAAQLATPLSVEFTLGGSADAGDYAPVTLTAEFLAGATSADVVVTPVADGVVEPAETVELTLAAAAGYQLDAVFAATLTIADEPPPVVTLSVPDPNAGEIANQGWFLLRRTGSTTLPLTVTVEYGGTATFGVDYKVSPNSLQVTIPAGSPTLTVWVTPQDDGIPEPMETITLTVVAGPGYDLGGIVSATMFIAAR